jgi:hypothetical protein
VRGTLVFLVAVLGLLVIQSSLGFNSSIAPQKDAVVGANLTNEPYKLSADELENILAAIESSGAHVIRASVPNNDAGINFAERAKAHGIKIELLLWPSPVAGTPWPHAPAGFQGLWRAYPLSKADPVQFRTYFEPLLAKLESSNIKFAGFELGNEINWAGFNADFSLPGEGRVLGAEDLVSDPEGQQIAKGYLAYLKSLAVLKDIRDHSKFNRDTPIISAGLADLGGSTWTHQRRAAAVEVSATLNFLRNHGLDRLVDGYGLHCYPHSSSLDQIRSHLEQNGLEQFQSPGSLTGKPCWITEWGAGRLSGQRLCPSSCG